MGWVLGQWVVGYFFNDFLMKYMIYGVILILVTLPLSVYSAYAYDLKASLAVCRRATKGSEIGDRLRA